MATKPIQVTDPWEMMALMTQKATIFSAQLTQVPHPALADVDLMAKYLARLNEMFPAFREWVASERAEFERRAAAEGNGKASKHN